MQQNELEHYGVVGMKWGIHKARRLSSRNEKLKVKATKYDRKSAVLTKKSEKLHAEKNLESSNRKAVKSAKYKAKAAKTMKKALREDNELKRTILEKRSAKLNYKATKAQVEGNRISKTKGYGAKAMKYSIKSDIVAVKAAKARKKIANNKAYIAKMDRKISSLTDEELRGAYSFVNEALGRN